MGCIEKLIALVILLIVYSAIIQKARVMLTASLIWMGLVYAIIRARCTDLANETPLAIGYPAPKEQEETTDSKCCVEEDLSDPGESSDHETPLAIDYPAPKEQEEKTDNKCCVEEDLRDPPESSDQSKTNENGSQSSQNTEAQRLEQPVPTPESQASTSMGSDINNIQCTESMRDTRYQDSEPQQLPGYSPSQHPLATPLATARTHDSIESGTLSSNHSAYISSYLPTEQPNPARSEREQRLRAHHQTLRDGIMLKKLVTRHEKDIDAIIRGLCPPKSWLGEYRATKQIGKGDTSEVYLGQDPISQMPLALKRIPANRDIPFFTACEVVAMKSLDHPNIMRLERTFQNAGSVYLVTKYMTGRDARTIMTQERLGVIPECLIGTVLREVLKGLAHMHEEGFVHCDVTTANILLNTEGEVKLGDLGCTIDSRLSQDHLTRGTREFMAPEVVYTNIHTSACDIWSLGMTATELFTGEQPFTIRTSCSNEFYVYEAIKKAKVVSPPEAASPVFSEFLNSCLQIDRASRLTAKELLEIPFIKYAPPTRDLIPRVKKGFIARTGSDQQS